MWLCFVVGAVEVGGGITLLSPRVASWGAGALIIVMAGAWVTRFGDCRMVDVAWISLYMVALAWIAFEWWAWRRPRIVRPNPPVSSA